MLGAASRIDIAEEGARGSREWSLARRKSVGSGQSSAQCALNFFRKPAKMYRNVQLWQYSACDAVISKYT